MLRLFQILTACMIVPVMCLGLMSSLSGGGMTPAFQQIGQSLMTIAPLVGIATVVASVLLQRADRPILAYIVLVVPIIFWIGQLIWLQRETGFFS
ncbi:MAG: hypothetical protein AAFV98_19605 [Chloroflexota bacterium]